MPLDYYVQNKDTGFNYNEAIQPVTNGEDANQTVFRRPAENLRTRTEDIRKQFDLLEAVVSSDRGLSVVADPTAYVHWDRTAGTFEVADVTGTTPMDFYIMPLIGGAQVTLGGGTAVPATFVYSMGTGLGSFITESHSTLRDHGDAGAGRASGANNLYVRVDESARTTGGVVISVEGDAEAGPTFPEDGPVTIVIELEQGGNTAAEIVAALQAAGDHDVYINTNSLKTKVLDTGACTKEITRRRFADGDIHDDGGGNLYHSHGAYDLEGILIDSTTLSAFFGISGNELNDGDTLVVNFTGADDRLNNQNDTSMSGMLKKLTTDALPDRNTWLASRRHVVPICKRFGDYLYFLNGTVYDNLIPGRLIPNPGDIATLSATYADHVAGTADKHADADITAEAHNGTGNPDDTSSSPGLPGPNSNVRTHIDQTLRIINRHMDAGVANFQHPYKDITNRPIVTVGAAGSDYTTIQSAYEGIAATGGIIIVEEGTYTGDTFYTSPTYPVNGAIDVIGRGVVKMSHGTTIVYYKDASGEYPLTFRNIEFEVTATGTTGHVISNATSDNPRDSMIFFDNCKFTRTAAALSEADIITITDGMVHCKDCTFDGNDITYNQRLVETRADSSVYFDGCYFTNIEKLWTSQGASDYISFKNNIIQDCGYSPNGTTIGYLVDAGNDHAFVEFIGNTWKTPVVATATAKFCNSLYGNHIVISGNRIENQGTIAGQSAQNFMFRFLGGTSNSHVVVANNKIDLGNLSGFELNSSARLHSIHDNDFYMDVGYTTSHVINGAGGVNLQGNNIFIANGTVSTYGIYANSAINSRITGNYVNVGANGTGIILDGCFDMTVQGNVIDGSGANQTTGIAVDGDRDITVVGNSIVGLGFGINLVSVNQNITVGNNAIEVGAFATGVGINIGSAVGPGVAVVGNAIKATVVASGKIGIGSGVVSAQVSIVGNSINSMGTGIKLTQAEEFTCTGNHIYVPDIDNSKGIDAAHSSSTDIHSVISGNNLMRAGSTNSSGSYGIDASNCEYCALSGNYIGPSGAFIIPLRIVGSTIIGLGEDLVAENVGTHNLFFTP